MDQSFPEPGLQPSQRLRYCGAGEAAGDVQVMSAGAGVRHSEYNEENGTTRIFQIWQPTTHGGTPSWGAKPFPKAERSDRFVTLAGGFAEDDALPIRADARVMGATVKAGERITLTLDPKRYVYLVPATGAVDVCGIRVEARDGTAITDLTTIEIVGMRTQKSFWSTPLKRRRSIDAIGGTPSGRLNHVAAAPKSLHRLIRKTQAPRTWNRSASPRRAAGRWATF